MAGEKRITIKFSTVSGEAKVEAFGFKGGSCTQAMKFLEDTLGKVTDFQHKAEYYEASLELTGTLDTSLCG